MQTKRKNNSNNAQTVHSRPTAFFTYPSIILRSWVTNRPDFRGTVPKNAPKIPRPETWLKCPVINQMKFFFTNSKRPHCHTDGTLHHYLHTGNCLRNEAAHSHFQQAVGALNLETSINLGTLCEEFRITKPTLALCLTDESK